MPWVEISEAAFTLGVSERTIRNWIKSGKLQSRNMGGRREVEIPDPEHSQATHAFADDDAEEGQGLEVQKRLEVALIECGRVKGTLASQERMMESLSANIAELNAKLQKSERTIGNRTIWCVVLASLGVVAYLVSSAWHVNRENTLILSHKEEQTTLRTSKQTEINNLKDAQKEEIKKLLDKKNQERVNALSQQQNRLATEHKTAMDALEAKLGKQIKDLEERNRILRNELDKEKEERMKLRIERDNIRKELENAEARLAEKEKLVADQKDRLGEAEKTNRELEEDLARWKAHYKREPPR